MSWGWGDTKVGGGLAVLEEEGFSPFPGASPKSNTLSSTVCPHPHSHPQRLPENPLLSARSVNHFPPGFQIKTSPGWGLREGSGGGGNVLLG